MTDRKLEYGKFWYLFYLTIPVRNRDMSLPIPDVCPLLMDFVT
jgi:hypothetical protein